MGVVRRRLLTLGIALAFFVGTTGQLVPYGMACGMIGMSVGMAVGPAQTKAPSGAPGPTCVVHLGCVGNPALPASPPSVAVALRWMTPAYDLTTAPLSGISLKPDLSPPILTA